MSDRSRRKIADATISRLPMYLRILLELTESGVAGVSSEKIAEMGGINAAKVRKDLSYLGSYGTRGVGYEVSFLIFQIQRELGVDHEWPVVIVGAGNLGQALIGSGGFGRRSYPIVGLVDIDEAKVGALIGSLRVGHIDELPNLIASQQVAIGVVAVPGEAAQMVADRLISAGVTSILNFAPIPVNVPVGISVRQVDLACELQILSFHEQHKKKVVPWPQVLPKSVSA
ncbi:MAG: redox-sensing transcriptional repressor Rex [Actinomycetota bacterium]